MGYKIRTRDEHFQSDGTPKRILALDGGGLRGILTLEVLAKIEKTLGKRHGGEDSFRLCHYFDLIAGTSTGAIIAAALALGRYANGETGSSTTTVTSTRCRTRRFSRPTNWLVPASMSSRRRSGPRSRRRPGR